MQWNDAVVTTKFICSVHRSFQWSASARTTQIGRCVRWRIVTAKLAPHDNWNCKTCAAREFQLQNSRRSSRDFCGRIVSSPRLRLAASFNANTDTESCYRHGVVLLQAPVTAVADLCRPRGVVPLQALVNADLLTLQLNRAVLAPALHGKFNERCGLFVSASRQRYSQSINCFKSTIWVMFYIFSH